VTLCAADQVARLTGSDPEYPVSALANCTLIARPSGRLAGRLTRRPPSLLCGLPGDAEPGADLGPGVASGAQAPDRLGDGSVQLVSEPGHEAECFDIAVGNWPVASITAAEVSGWVGSLVARGLAPSTATRALATLRSILAFAVADARIQHNVAAAVRRPTSGHARREGQALTLDELRALMEACQGRYRDLVPVLVLAGLRWGELVGLQVGYRVSIPGPGLRLRRTVLASGGGGALYVDTLKSNRGRTVPLVLDLVPIVDRWSAGKAPDAWLFEAPHGGPLRESNWKRSVGWSAATAAAGLRGFRVHDLRHTAASVWLAARADPKVVQRVLGHATASMTMDLYGHLMDVNLWEAARAIGGILGASEPTVQQDEDADGAGSDESAW
jgi:integrase